ncbi:heme biosynthesis protein HemY [Phaeovulum vinaykumarii]|uniref:HemY protein n=1 Tax=Phaeovulum vinaykumarii TaxID=407234 RepID=A0A1N7MAC3_9RHOB|nr:heme biosynthesis HemY N-terminal domain-containing protein [Phaeovulum vinaykumarii]SIS82921.1 HemY protein [Phaeovulum vinaykumarii]SOC10555.1 HemY protein [Phaeovulum vinaykumarii]
MIRVIIKVLLFFAAVGAAAVGATYLADSGQSLRIVVANWEFNLGALQAVIVALAGLFAIWLLFKLLGLGFAFLRFLLGDTTAVTRFLTRTRARKGYEALAEGMLAIASGEGRIAQVKAQRAERYLKRPELTQLLAAQAAEVAGDPRKAEAAYKNLLNDKRTRFVGIQGLMRLKLTAGDTATALKLAEKAFALKPRHQEVQNTLLKLQTEKGDWKGARNVLGAKARQGLLPRDVHRRRDALLALQEAKGIFAEGATIQAREAAIAAAKSSPDLVPAVVLASQAYIEKGDAKNATRVLVKAWEANPHPDIAAAFAAIEPDETPAQRLTRFETLVAAYPSHVETRLLQAELYVAAEDFVSARRALGDLTEKEPNARVLAIMAAIARGEGEDDAVVRGFLSRALVASRGPQWCCDKCHNIQAEWAPVCDNCGSFDTLSWREPPQGGVGLSHGAELLPLIVSGPKSAQAGAAAAPEAAPAS